jgi:hypothetical protein
MFVYPYRFGQNCFGKVKNFWKAGFDKESGAQKRQSHHRGESQSGMTIRASVWVHDAVTQFV